MITSLIVSFLLGLVIGAALTLICMRATRSAAVIGPPAGFDSDPMMAPDDLQQPGDNWRRYARVGDTGPERIALRTVTHGEGGTISTQGIALPNSGYPLDHHESQAMSAEAVAAINLPRTDTGD